MRYGIHSAQRVRPTGGCDESSKSSAGLLISERTARPVQTASTSSTTGPKPASGAPMNTNSIDGSRPNCTHGKMGAELVRALLRLVAVFLAFDLLSQAALAQVMYRIKPLGYLGTCTSVPRAYGFNASDQVTGSACNSHGDTHAFLWKNNGTAMIDLGPSQVGSSSIGYGINASGLVAGSATDS